ncbi:MAG: cytochrome c1 [Gammaproteobacteria bacterium]|nr:cytochrome c1 [Gammaproteobacteria bacterium]NND35706.1 cytochrome c1 [Gammaproteobacteria bacterium]
MRQIAGRALIVALILSPVPSFAAGGSAPLLKAENDVSNTSSLQRGARNFVNYCMGCHSAQYVRYNRLAADLQISEDQLVNNLMFAGGKPHDRMEIAMPSADAERWFGVAPPDLSLIARSRGTDYLFTFLKGFYVDESRPTGVNNIVLENAAMPNVLWQLQGSQRALFSDEEHDGVVTRVFEGFEQIEPGAMSPKEFDQFVRDLVNFLEYIGEPVQMQRRQLGIWVLTFLLVFGLFAWALKQEIWKDIK